MSSDQRDDRDRNDDEDRRRADDRDRGRDRDERDRDRDYDDRRRSRYDDHDDRPRRRRRPYDDDYYDRPRSKGSNTLIIVLVIVGLVVVGGGVVFYFAVSKVREAAARAKSQNNLKEMALAMHNHNDAHGHFPSPAICDRQGKPLLSWRVAILPYIGQGPLYNQFRLDEPWDSPANQKLIPMMPKIYAPISNQGVADEYKTYYRMIYPKGEIDIGITVQDLQKSNKGASQSLMIVEAGEPVIWTKPDELEYEEGGPLPSFGGVLPKSKTFNVAFYDGSVQAIRRDEADTLRAMIRPKAVRLKK